MNHKKSFKARTKVKIAEKKCSEYLISKEIPHHEFGFDPYNNPIPTKEFYLLPETIHSTKLGKVSNMKVTNTPGKVVFGFEGDAAGGTKITGPTPPQAATDK